MIERLASAVVDELEDRGLVGEGDDIVPIQKYTYEKDIARTTVYRMLDWHDLPVRDVTGAKKGDSKGIACVSRTELAMETALDTRVVRRADGQYE